MSPDYSTMCDIVCYNTYLSKIDHEIKSKSHILGRCALKPCQSPKSCSSPNLIEFVCSKEFYCLFV